MVLNNFSLKVKEILKYKEILNLVIFFFVLTKYTGLLWKHEQEDEQKV